jgi:GST-like protein
MNKSKNMIDVYSWPTPNGHKVHVMLEECGLAYRAHAVNIGKNEQFKPEFLAMNPKTRIMIILKAKVCYKNQKTQFRTQSV